MNDVTAITLVNRPLGIPDLDDFEVVKMPEESLTSGKVRLKVLDLSLDPYVASILGEGHMGDALPIGAVVPGRSVSEVVDAGDSQLENGSLVVAETGWRTQAVVDSAQVRPVSVPAHVPASMALGVLGMPGLTAYAAHVRHVSPKVGDTIVVSSATGGVGTLAGALARLAGARVVAVVGSEAKKRLAVERLGYDAAVVRAEADWVEQLQAECPTRIDGYYHMGDQRTLDGVIEHLAIGARVSLIGLVDQTKGALPPRLRAGALMSARAVAHGMVVYDHNDLGVEHQTRVGDLLARGEIEVAEDRYADLANAPNALRKLLTGDTQGKAIVEVAKKTPTTP